MYINTVQILWGVVNNECLNLTSKWSERYWELQNPPFKEVRNHNNYSYYVPPTLSGFGEIISNLIAELEMEMKYSEIFLSTGFLHREVNRNAEWKKAGKINKKFHYFQPFFRLKFDVLLIFLGSSGFANFML